VTSFNHLLSPSILTTKHRPQPDVTNQQGLCACDDAAMAALSKLVLPGDRKLRAILYRLTSLYVSNRSRISRAVWITLFLALANRIRHAISEQKAASVREASQRAARRGTTSSSGGEETPRKKVELNRDFFRSLLRLLRIVVPGWKSKEARLLMSHSFFLILRTLISLRVAEMDGAIVKALVKGNGKEFLKRIVWWMLIAVPATFTNSMVSIITNYLHQIDVYLHPVSYPITRPSYRSSIDRASPSSSTTSTCQI
jgi:hypothetical protein